MLAFYPSLDLLDFYREELSLRRLLVVVEALLQGQHPKSLLRARMHDVDRGTLFSQGEEFLAALIELSQRNNQISHVAGQLKGTPDKIHPVKRPQDRDPKPGEMQDSTKNYLDSLLPPELDEPETTE